ncbi:MAG: arginine--tRNA ligase [Candidatus Gracilibacteria bacterium]|nr:arginine--tRNA ligase [Candidatus Gracilibacteria bacterium]
MNLNENLKELLTKSLSSAYPELSSYELNFEHPADLAHGDFACNVALALSKELKQNPRQIAEKILENLPKSKFISKAEIAGPGFINFFLSQEFLNEELADILDKAGKYGISKIGKKEKVILEYSSPNTNKPQHVGHLRNNLLGLSLIKILEANSFQVKTACVFNDRGMGVSKAMVAYEEFAQGKTPKSENKKPDHFVGDMYVMFQQKLAEHPELEQAVKENLEKWEAGDKATIDLWKKMRDWVLEGYQETYARLGIKFDLENFESDIYMRGKKIVEDGLQQGVFYKKEDGSVWIDLRDEGLDEKLLLRGNGTAVYMTQDLYLTLDRIKKIGESRVVFVVASEQLYHFKVLFSVFKKLGFKWADKCFHLAYGMVNMEGAKIKSREGTVLDLDNLMDQMHELAFAEVQKRYGDLSPEEMHKMAEKVAQGALRYGILKVDAMQDICFDLKRAVTFEGNTGPYLQYTHARICQILKQETFDPKASLDSLKETEEENLLRKLYLYPEVVEEAAQNYKPSLIANYLYDLATAFNTFYHKHTVLKADEELKKARLKLIAATAQVLKNGLELLSIEAPERM